MGSNKKYTTEVSAIAGDAGAFATYADQGFNGLLTSIINFAFAPFIESQPFTEAGFNVMGWEPSQDPAHPWNLLVEAEGANYDEAYEAVIEHAGDSELDPYFEDESAFAPCDLANLDSYDHEWDERGLPVWPNGEGGYLAVHEAEHMLALQKLWADLQATDDWRKRITIVTERHPEMVKRRVEQYPYLRAYVTI